MEDIYRNGNYRRKSSHHSKHSAKTINYRPQYNNRNSKNRKRRKKAKRMEEPKLNKKKVFMVMAIPILIIMFINNKKDKNIEVSGKGTDIKESQSTTETNNTNNINMPTQTTNTSTNSTQTTNKVEITDWRLRLANYDNLLPEDFEVELANIDNSKDPKQFDARAVKYLKDMINAM